MWARKNLLRTLAASAVAVLLAGRAVAELITALFPEGVPGYNVDEGVTVATRLHPEQMPLGMRAGAFQFLPQLDESIGYTSNALPGPHRQGSWEVTTAPALSIGSDGPDDRFGALFSLQNTRYLALPNQDRTDATAAFGGQLDVGGDRLNVWGAHLGQHEDRGALDTIASDRPIAFQIDDARVSYAMTRDRWLIEPKVQAANWSYDDTTILGIPNSQAYRDRVVVQGGVTLHYELAPLRSLVLVARAIEQDYTRTPAGQPSPDSVSYQVLTGLDYNDNSVWHWRLLFGGEARDFASNAYRQQNTFIAEGGVGWSPSGMTTVSATVSRETGDAEQQGLSGLIYTGARLKIDHEYLRNVLLRASVGWQRGDFFQGGHQTGASAGAGVTWVLSRSARLSFTYDQTEVQAASVPAQASVPGYSRGVGLVTMRLAL